MKPKTSARQVGLQAENMWKKWAVANDMEETQTTAAALLSAAGNTPINIGFHQEMTT
jgi:hypothetical protein